MDQENIKEGEDKKIENPIQTKNEPLFTNNIIEELYYNSLKIDHSLVNKILQLPRQSLIKDLEKVALDSIYRYEYFNNKIDKEGYKEEDITFPIHALFLLAELKAEESLTIILDLLRQDEEHLHFWYFDILEDVFFETLYNLANNNLNALKNFLLEYENSTYARSVISVVVSQIALNRPERRNEVISWFKEVIEYFLNEEDNKIDVELLSFLICDLIDFNCVELKSEIASLYEAGIVFPGICGSFKHVLRDISRPLDYSHKMEIKNIFERYDYMQIYTEPSDDYDEEMEYDDLDFDDDFDFTNEKPNASYKALSKIGRNELCPCGSGKKYKKCCMNKK